MSGKQQLQWYPLLPPTFEVFRVILEGTWPDARSRVGMRQLAKAPQVRKPTAATLAKCDRASTELAKGRKKSQVAKQLGYRDYRALNKMLRAVDAYRRHAGIAG